MDSQTANILNRTTTAFYAAQAASFSATRQSGWPGWQRVIGQCDIFAQGKTVTLLDVACGNQRFRAFLEKRGLTCDYRGIDSCKELAGEEVECCDIVKELIDGSFALTPASADLAVCFGFFHHVPGIVTRKLLLRALCEATRPGGLVAVSLWRFMASSDLAQKAQASHEKALQHFAEQGISLALDENDYLLGWQTQTQNFRYCHHSTLR